MVPAEIRTRVRRDPVAAAVATVVVFALLARLVALGDRVAHFDEARVAWWTLEYARTGQFQYRHIIHGPFLQHLNAAVFGLIGPSDFAVRLAPALVGGLLPLSALLFRERLRGSEVVALALVLAFDPVLLYYSRFSRSTIPVAAFAFVAFGLFVRALDSRDARPGYVGVAFVALAFTAKENAVVYVLVWVGATALLIDHHLYSPRSDESGLDRLRSHRPIGRARLWMRPFLRHAAVSVAVFAAVVVFFYAPRGVDVGLFRSLANPTALPAMLDATIGVHPERFAGVGWRGGYDGGIIGGLEYWFGGPSRSGQDANVVTQYVERLGKFVALTATYATALAGLAAAGFLAERYGAARPRDLVTICGYWGIVSVLGYPLGSDIWAGWITVNALVPLAVPAAVGLAMVYRWGREALADEDRIGAGLAVFVLLLVVGQVATVAIGSVYLQPTAADNRLVQYAQPHQDLRPLVRDMSAVAAENEGPDVLVYDAPDSTWPLVDGDERALRTPACLNWIRALPYPWYVDAERMEVRCASSFEELEREAAARPPFVIARADDREAVARRLPGYRVHGTYLHRKTGFRKVVFVHDDVLPK